MAWTQTANIRGASGASGPPGPQGPTGATGASGGTGGTGGPGTTSWNDITDKPGAILNYKGTWNVSTNSPTLSDSTGSGGDVYRVSAAGSRNLGSGSITFDVGDYVIYNGSVWQKADTTDAVSTVAGRTGDVVLTKSDVGLGNVDNTADAAKEVLSASKLTTPRTINGVSFDGTANITVPAGIQRVVQTITTPTTLGGTAGTDYVAFCSSSGSGDPSFSSVVSLVHADGTNNSTTITDSASTPLTWNCSGNAKLSTGTKKFGTASVSFDGSSSTYISAASSSAVSFSSDFTIECWAYTTSSAVQGIFQQASTLFPSNLSATLGVLFNASGQFQMYANGAAINSASGLWTTNTWYHVAVVRSGTTTKLYVNGTAVLTATSDSTNYSGQRIGFGSIYGGNYLTGFVDEIRMSNIARYTSDFTPSASAFADVVQTLGTPTLPTAVGSTNLYTIKNISGTTLTVGTTSSQQIDGSSSYSLTNGSVVRMISDGSNWRTV